MLVSRYGLIYLVHSACIICNVWFCYIVRESFSVNLLVITIWNIRCIYKLINGVRLTVLLQNKKHIKCNVLKERQLDGTGLGQNMCQYSHRHILQMRLWFHTHQQQKATILLCTHLTSTKGLLISENSFCTHHNMVKLIM